MRREDGGEAAVDEVGEVCVRSGSSAREYWNKPEATAETFAGGWCRTGDLGRLRPDGRLQITGRLKDMIRSGGENIYPVEIENVLMALPAVADAAVIAVPDEKYGETVCAVVVLEDGAELSAEELIAHCREQLASYKKPRHVVFARRAAALPHRQGRKGGAARELPPPRERRRRCLSARREAPRSAMRSRRGSRP